MKRAYGNILYRLFKINLDNVDDRNAYYLVLEILFASILGSAAGFNAAFAIRLGATNADVGWLTSVPALLAVLISIPAGRFLERRTRRAPWVFGSVLVHRIGFLLVAVVPWLHLPGFNQGQLLVITLILINAPAYFFNVGWTPLLADVIPEGRRAAVFSARNMVNSAMVSLMGFLFGQWLARVAFPINYQLMYLFGFAASVLSFWAMAYVRVPDSTPYRTPVQAKAMRSPRDFYTSLTRAFVGQPQFLAITRNTLLYSIGLWLASPLYILYFVRQLEAKDDWIGINATVGALATIAGYALWRWVIVRWGEEPTLKRAIHLPGFYPLLVGLTPSLGGVLVLSALNGLANPGVGLSHFNTLLKSMPADQRPSYTAIYTTIMNVGAFVCPIIGVAVANAIGIAPTLIIAGVLTGAGSFAFTIWPIGIEQSTARA